MAPLEDAETPNEGEEGDAEELGERSGRGSPASRVLSGGTDAAPADANAVVSQGADWGVVSPGVAWPRKSRGPGPMLVEEVFGMQPVSNVLQMETRERIENLCAM